MIADLHCHYAMHLLGDADQPRLRHALRRGISLGDRLRAFVMWVANRVANFRKWSSGPRVTLDKLEKGGARLVLSVLLVPLDEIDLGQPYASPPLEHYYRDLLDQIGLVEDDLRKCDPKGRRHLIAHRAADLDDPERIAFVHCVEGGFHLGTTEAEIRAHVAELARRGVAYVTLAHLFFRGIATNAPALPFLSDACYDRLFPQPEEGLTALGRAAVDAMFQHKVLVDLSHMNPATLTEVLDRLDELDPGHTFPVVASHTGIRFQGTKERYLLAEDTVRRIGERDGVIGLIMAQHQLQDGVRKKATKKLEDTIEVICAHIDRIEGVCGAGHVGLGTDLDGFIKPTMGGIESAEDLRKLRDPLLAHYHGDAAKVDGVLYGNAHRMVRRVLAAR